MADGEKRIIELEELTTLTDNDYIAVDNSASGGKTKKFKPKNLQDATNQVLEDVAYLTWENNHYYNRGDIVAYEGYLYVCKVDEATYGSFVSSEWKKTYVERWGRDLFFDISMKEMTFSDSGYTLPYSKGDVVYRYYPHPSNDGFEMRFYVAKADYPNGVTEYVASQWDEYYSLSEVVDALNKETNKSVDESLAEGTASGSIASFTDGSTLPMRKLEVDIEPVQDLHGYENPWVGGSGKNLLGVNSRISGEVAQVVYTSDAEYLYLNGTKSGSGYADMTSLTITLGSGTYYIKAFVISGTASNTVELYPFNGTNNLTGNIIGNERTLTLSEEQTFRFRFAIWSDGTVLTNYKIGIVVSKTSNIDKFYPYSNICPISGWDEVNVTRCGVNVWDEEWEQGVISIKTGQNVSGNGIRSKNYSNCKGKTSYYFSVGQTADYIMWYDKDKNFINHTYADSSKVVTSPSNAYYFKIRIDAISTYSNNVSINYPSTDTSYHAYNGQVYTIDLDGTRYGGTLDVVSGVLTVDRVTISGRVTSLSSNTYSNIVYGTIEKPNDSKNKGNTEVHNLISSMYPVSPIITGWDNANNIGKMFVGASYTQFWLGFPLGTTLQDAQTETNNNVLCYELATPLTIQLTPTEVKSLLATNNVFADTGDILDATYVRNANITINDLIRRIENLENA